jgi:hypothetical protein
MAANNAHGWDDECSGAFFVNAESAEAATITGCEVAEQFVRQLFVKAGCKDIPSWKAAEFAFWIEVKPSEVFSQEALEKLPHVNPGEIPDFSGWSY